MRLSTLLLHSPYMVGLAAASVAMSGCSGGALTRDQTRAASIAEVPGGTLTGATLERWLLKLPQPPSTITASVLVSTWINTSLAIDAIRRNVPLDDSITTDEVIRPDAERGVTLQYFAERDARRAPVTDAQADSLLDVDRVRVFQQILIHVPQDADSATGVAAIERARGLERRARAGADFGALAIEASPDSATRNSNGFLPAIAREQTSRLPQRMQQIWMLKPGDISEVIGSPIGLHVMRRATRVEARPWLKKYLAPILAHRADSMFIDSIARAHHIEVAPDARPRARALAMEPVIAADSSPLATWQGGTLTPAMVRSATLMLDAGARAQLSNASDSTITSYLTELAKRRIVIGVVAPGPNPTPAARSVLGPAYRNAIASIRTTLNRIPASLTPGDAATQYLDSALVARQSVKFPGALTEVLRTGAKIRVDSVALLSVLRTVAPEWRAQHANDSSAAAKSGAGKSGVRPAAPRPR